ncbi:MAG TPA: DUF2244 domain-containing protein [Gammaproteobacteria bacterium]|nr:DUF2244 domain-containing protein [Gammaproteobacteria bacterium]HIL18984.1 DUF2244 domain-containing protein [Gammaproteobacteria bacterium]
MSHTGQRLRWLRRRWARGHPSRLYIDSHGRCVEIGHDLTEEDRIELAHRLGRLLPTT